MKTLAKTRTIDKVMEIITTNNAVATMTKRGRGRCRNPREMYRGTKAINYSHTDG